jgi:predicted transcriptional regulator
MDNNNLHLSRRERQIMDIIYRQKEATVTEVLEEIPSPPTYTTVRTLLRLLEQKGHLKHRQDGPRYVFSATVPKKKAQESAMRQLLRTFFDGSTSRAVAALIDLQGDNLSDDELKQLDGLLKEMRKKGR